MVEGVLISKLAKLTKRDMILELCQIRQMLHATVSATRQPLGR